MTNQRPPSPHTDERMHTPKHDAQINRERSPLGISLPSIRCANERREEAPEVRRGGWFSVPYTDPSTQLDGGVQRERTVTARATQATVNPANTAVFNPR